MGFFSCDWPLLGMRCCAVPRQAQRAHLVRAGEGAYVREDVGYLEVLLNELPLGGVSFATEHMLEHQAVPTNLTRAGEVMRLASVQEDLVSNKSPDKQGKASTPVCRMVSTPGYTPPILLQEKKVCLLFLEEEVFPQSRSPHLAQTLQCSHWHI